jgi:hypothetical protein
MTSRSSACHNADQRDIGCRWSNHSEHQHRSLRKSGRRPHHHQRRPWHWCSPRQSLSSLHSRPLRHLQPRPRLRSLRHFQLCPRSRPPRHSRLPRRYQPRLRFRLCLRSHPCLRFPGVHQAAPHPHLSPRRRHSGRAWFRASGQSWHSPGPRHRVPARYKFDTRCLV